MKNALIDPSAEIFNYDDLSIKLGLRIAEVADQIFPVADPLFWVEVSDDIIADLWYWNGAVAVLTPAAPIIPIVISNPSEITVL
jgi:hypothetical protein